MNHTSNYNYILEFNQILKECDSIYHNAAVKAGLSDCAFWILYTLQDSTRTYTQSEICDDGFMPKQTVNSALKKMEKDGYLTLHPIPGKKGKYIQLTETGQAFVQQKIVPIMKAEENACAQFTSDEKFAFLNTFRGFVNWLKTEVTSVQEENGNEK